MMHTIKSAANFLKFLESFENYILILRPRNKKIKKRKEKSRHHLLFLTKSQNNKYNIELD